jgi:hypothetical protein
VRAETGQRRTLADETVTRFTEYSNSGGGGGGGGGGSGKGKDNDKDSKELAQWRRFVTDARSCRKHCKQHSVKLDASLAAIQHTIAQAVGR